MAAAFDANDRQTFEGTLVKRGVVLLSQQVWCWGRDILRPEGNWLIEVGFERTAAPADRENCSSLYRLDLPAGRRVVLRGFGVFYGDDRIGGVFLPRYEFRPRYTPDATLRRPAWSPTDLPRLDTPDESQRDACAWLTADLIDWIQSYEATVGEQLGIDYRRATLHKWDTGERPVVPADEMVDSWRSLGASIARGAPASIPRT